MRSKLWTQVLILAEEALPFPFYFFRVRRKLREADSLDLLKKTPFSGYLTLPEQQLLDCLKDERSRATAMDEKTFKMSLSLSFGLTVLGSTAAFLLEQVSHRGIKVVLASTIGLGLIYVLCAGFIALGALKTLRSYGYGTRFLTMAPGARRRAFADSLARQETMNIVRHLRNETAYQALRNGLFFIFTSVAIFAAAMVLDSVAPSLWENSLAPLGPGPS